MCVPPTRDRSQSWYDWRSTHGYFSFGPPGGTPLLVRKIADGVTYRGGVSYGYGGFGGHSTGHSYKTHFSKRAGFGTIERIFEDELDDAGKAEAEAVRLTALQHPRAFSAFLDECGGPALDMTITWAMASNKATYVNLTASTPGGTAFDVEVRPPLTATQPAAQLAAQPAAPSPPPAPIAFGQWR